MKGLLEAENSLYELSPPRRVVWPRLRLEGVFLIYYEISCGFPGSDVCFAAELIARRWGYWPGTVILGTDLRRLIQEPNRIRIAVEVRD